MVKSNALSSVSGGSTMFVHDRIMLQFYAGVIVRVYCQVGKRRQAEFALRVAVRTLYLHKE